jgi:hypothetical protein
MSQDNQQDPIEEAGGYGTPSVEQELPGGGATESGGQDQDSAGEPGAGSSGGTEEQMSSENAGADTAYDKPASEEAEVAVPSSEADIDENNTEDTDSGRPFSSEPGQDASGLPDGSGTDLPESKTPNDSGDDEASFDAG